MPLLLLQPSKSNLHILFAAIAELLDNAVDEVIFSRFYSNIINNFHFIVEEA